MSFRLNLFLIAKRNSDRSASARSLWCSQSTDTDQGSCESLNVRTKRRMKLNSALIMGQRDILINLKKKMKKKTPKYQVISLLTVLC